MAETSLREQVERIAAIKARFVQLTIEYCGVTPEEASVLTLDECCNIITAWMVEHSGISTDS